MADHAVDVTYGRAAQRPLGLRPVVPAVVVYLARIAGVTDQRLDLRRQARSRTRIVDAVGNAGAQCPAATDPTFSHARQLAREAAKRRCDLLLQRDRRLPLIEACTRLIDSGQTPNPQLVSA